MKKYHAENLNNEQWRQVKSIFNECVSLTPTERLKILEQATRDCPKLREEVESLLGAHDSAKVVSQSADPVQPIDREPSLLTPDRVGRYRIKRRLGIGGMCEVFLAVTEGAQNFQKQVALKRLLPAYAENDDCRTLFEFEARLCSRLSHPNIVSVYDFISENGQNYLIMEYVPGAQLLDLCKKLAREGQALTADLSIHVIKEILRALEYAHTLADETSGVALEIVHRDVSPTNVMVSYDGEIKLLDFGIAKARDRVRLTRPGDIRGTLRYLAPERLSGKAVDGRSDLYSIAVLCYELLAGQVDVSEAGVPALSPDTSFDIDALHVSDDLKNVLWRALASNPSERFQSAAALLEVLGAISAPDSPKKRLSEIVLLHFPKSQQRRRDFLMPNRGWPPKHYTRPLRSLLTGVALGLLLSLALVVDDYSSIRIEEVHTRRDPTSSALTYSIDPNFGDCTTRIDSIPPGATVFLDSTHYAGRTPTQVSLPCGSRVILSLWKKGYRSRHQLATLSAERGYLELKLQEGRDGIWERIALLRSRLQRSFVK